MPARILVVDDSVTIRNVVTTILKRHGYFAIEAVDGLEALEVLTDGEVKIDLVLLDFVMPRMNGFQFCRALRQKTELCMTPIVLMSAKSDRIREQFVQQTGAIDALTKPFDADALLLVVENALRKLEGGKASSSRLLDADDGDDSRTGMSDRPEGLADPKEALMQSLQVALERATPGAGEFAARFAKASVARELVKALDGLDALSSPGRGSRWLSGDLRTIPIGAVLQLLQVEGLSGALVCENHESRITATFRKGLIDLVESRGARDEFRLGRYFIEEGLVSPGQIDEVLGASLTESSQMLERQSVTDVGAEKTTSNPVLHAAESRDVPEEGADEGATVEVQAAPEKPLGDRLLERKLIDATQLNNALVRQSSELIYDLLRWPAGTFEFREAVPSRFAESARLGLPVAAVVMEGFRRVDEWRLLEASLGNFDSVLLRDESTIDQMGRSSLPRQEAVVLDGVDGVRTIREVITESHLSSFDACRVLAQFLEARLVRRRMA